MPVRVKRVDAGLGALGQLGEDFVEKIAGRSEREGGGRDEEAGVREQGGGVCVEWVCSGCVVPVGKGEVPVRVKRVDAGLARSASLAKTAHDQVQPYRS